MSKRQMYLLALFMLMTQWPAGAAQTSMSGTTEDVLDHIESVLTDAQASIADQAYTERFALIYAARNDGGHVTITIQGTLRDANRITLVVTSDSPHDAAFDERLLRALVDARSSSR